VTCNTCNGTGFVPSYGEPTMVSFCPACRPDHGYGRPQTGAVRNEGNVRILQGVTRLDIPVERILAGAGDADLKLCVVVGEEQDGSLYFASNKASGPEVLWALERAKQALLKAGGAA
jgi:hypothetical protein